MRILRRNKRRDLPQRIFEVGDVISGCRKRRHLCGVVMDSRSSFTESKSYMEAVLREMGAEYELEHCTDRTFIPGRGAAVTVEGRRIGSFGEVSPEVIEGFEITHPVMMMELDLQWFIDARRGRCRLMDVGERFPPSSCRMRTDRHSTQRCLKA